MLYSIFSFILQVIGWVGLIYYLCWAVYALYRAMVKAGKNGTLPWL